MKKNYFRYMILLPIFLAAVFLLRETHNQVFATEKSKAEISSYSVRNAVLSVTPNAFLAEWKTKGFSKKKPVNVKVYMLKNSSDMSGTNVFTGKKKANDKEIIKLSSDTSGYFYFLIEIKQGKKTAKKISEIPLYVFGDNVPREPKDINVRYIDGAAEIKFKAEPGAKYMAELYDLKTNEVKGGKAADEGIAVFKNIDGIEKPALTVAEIKDGKRGDFFMHELPDKDTPNVLVNFSENADVINVQEITADIVFTGSCIFDIEVNGYPEVEGSKDNGRYTVELPEGKSDIIVTVTADNGNIKHFNKTVIVDTLPPLLELDGGLDGAVTSENEIIISGKCENEAVLTVNGSKKAVKDGEFSFKFNLSKGANEINLVSEDKAGNMTKIRAAVTREAEHKTDIKAMILVGVTFAVIMAAYLITFMGWLSKRGGRRTKS